MECQSRCCAWSNDNRWGAEQTQCHPSSLDVPGMYKQMFAVTEELGFNS